MTSTLKIHLGEALTQDDLRRLLKVSMSEGKSIDAVVIDAVRAKLAQVPLPTPAEDADRETALVA
jgi:hypothetical protein